MRRHVYYYTHVAQPAERVQELIAGDPSRWLPLPAVSDGTGWRSTLHADGALPAALAAQEVIVHVDAPTIHPGGLLRRVRWQSASAARVFPILEGDLELSTLDDYGVQLSLLGAYRPPLSVVGDTGDRLLGHRVAEACIRRFVLDIEARAAATAVTADA